MEHHKMKARPIEYPEYNTIKRRQKKRHKEKTLQDNENILHSELRGETSTLCFFSENKEKWLQTIIEKYPGFNITMSNGDGKIKMNAKGMFDITGEQLISKVDKDFQEMKKKVSKIEDKEAQQGHLSRPAKRRKRQEDLNEEGASTTGYLPTAKKRARPSDDDN